MAEQTSSSRIISLDRYTLYAGSANSAGRRGRLVWSVRDGMVRVTVFTNDPADTDSKQMISLPVDAAIFSAIMDLTVRCARAKEETTFTVDIMMPVRNDDKKIIDKSNIGQIAVGRSADGIVWMAALIEGRPKIKCIYAPGQYAVFKKADGSEFTANEASSMYAIGHTEMLRNTVNSLVTLGAQNYVPKSRDFQGAGASNAGGGEKKTSSSSDGFDDVPY